MVFFFFFKFFILAYIFVYFFFIFVIDVRILFFSKKNELNQLYIKYIYLLNIYFSAGFSFFSIFFNYIFFLYKIYFKKFFFNFLIFFVYLFKNFFSYFIFWKPMTKRTSYFGLFRTSRTKWSYSTTEEFNRFKY